MTRRNEIIAISEYYNISMKEASEKINTMSEKELENAVEWFLDKVEDMQA